MGWLSDFGGFVSSAASAIGDFFSSSNGSSGSSSSRSDSYYSTSNTQTIYEPDKVRVAELENQGRKDLIQGQKDIIELNARMQAAVIEANVRGFEYSANILKSLMADMNIIAQQRLILLENGHSEIVENIERLYISFEREIKKDNDAFQLEKLPQMFQVLNQFPENSAAHKMYAGSIDKQIELNIHFVADKLSGLKQRQQTLIDSSVECKKLVLEHSNQIVQDRLLFLENQIKANSEPAQLNAPESFKALPKQNNAE